MEYSVVLAGLVRDVKKCGSTDRALLEQTLEVVGLPGEHVWHHEAQQRHQLKQVVLERSAGQ